MEHPDDETLALLALGEAGDAAGAREHLAACESCAAEVASLSGTVRLGRTTMDLDRLATPEPRVWSAIERELGLPVSTAVAAAPGRRRPRRGRLALALGLAASVVVVGGIAAAIALRGSATPEGWVLDAVRLEAFPAWEGASGRAEVVANGSGGRRLEVRLSAAEVPKGDEVELWLIDPARDDLVSLGELSGRTGSFAIPKDVDLAAYSVVDLSDEPPDGDPAHSGDSIARGSLTG